MGCKIKKLYLLLFLCLGLSPSYSEDLTKDTLIQINVSFFKTKINITKNDGVELYHSYNYEDLENYIYLSLSKYGIPKNKISFNYNVYNIIIKVSDISQTQIEQLNKFKLSLEKLLTQNYSGVVEIQNKNESNILTSTFSTSLYNPSEFGISHITSGKSHKDTALVIEFVIGEDNNIITKINGLISYGNKDYLINQSIPFINDKEIVYPLEIGMFLKIKSNKQP